MQFKCVLKAWNALIRHDANFVKSHIVHSHARGPSAIHLLFELCVVRTIHPRACELEFFSLELAPHHYSDTRVNINSSSNHCNGLAVCFCEDMSQVYLYNVTTGETKALPSSLTNWYGHNHYWFLGFDRVMEKYKLLHVFNFSGRLKMEILTLGTNSWGEIESIRQTSTPGNFSRDCVFLNGILHWRGNSITSCIKYFDFIEEKIGILSPPEYRNKMKPATLRKKLVQYLPFGERYEKCHLISDEVKKIFMRYNSDDPNSEKVVTLKVEAERSYEREHVLATTSFISATSTLVFPNHFISIHVSSFVENIIPLSFVDKD